MAHPSRRRVFLVGPSGAGKSAVGKCLAERLQWAYVDLDREIERRAGLSISEIFRTQKEQGFRVWEHDTATAWIDREYMVLATGGGAVQDADVRSLLRMHGSVIYLYAALEILLQRAEENIQHRPLLQGDDRRACMERMLREREPLYRSLADLSIDTGNGTPQEAATRIQTWLQSQPT